MKPLLDLHKDTAHHPTGTLKEKTVEIVLFHEPVQSWQSPLMPVTHEMAYTDVIPEIFPPAIFQPPRQTLNA